MFVEFIPGSLRIVIFVLGQGYTSRSSDCSFCIRPGLYLTTFESYLLGLYLAAFESYLSRLYLATFELYMSGSYLVAFEWCLPGLYLAAFESCFGGVIPCGL